MDTSMLYLLVKNEVKDFDQWLEVFRSEDGAAREYGLIVEKVWQDAQDPHAAWFLMRAESVERANAFMARPESAEVGTRAGVTGGAYNFLEEVGRSR
jgi:hypothetical protein